MNFTNNEERNLLGKRWMFVFKQEREKVVAQKAREREDNLQDLMENQKSTAIENEIRALERLKKKQVLE